VRGPEIARSKRQMLPTVADVAKSFGVSRRTVHDWIGAGCPGKGESGFDVEAIRTWREANRRPRDEPGDEDKEDRSYWAKRKEAALAQQEELELATAKGEMIEVDYVARLLARHIAEHNTQLAQLKDRVLALLPRKMKAADRRRILAGIDKSTDDLRSLMAQASEQLAIEIGPAEDE
jgi:phage terminase Nu1 subunit (DNA packaging protein)